MQTRPYRSVQAMGTTEAHQPVALILSDSEPLHLGKLTLQRTRAALPFAGEYRLIDFALSNCLHSGMESVGVITQYQPRSLHTHLAYGRPWDLDRREGGLTLLHPYQGLSAIHWYNGTADAVYQNLDFIHRHQTDQTLILSGDQIYVMDFNTLLAQHRESQADLTVVCMAVSPAEAQHHHTVIVDQAGWVQRLIPPGNDPDGTAFHPGELAVMGILLFSTEVLIWRLNEDAEYSGSTHSLIGDLIPQMIQAGDRIQAFQYAGYWNRFQTTQEYWQSNLDMLGERPSLNLQDTGWPIITPIQARPPTRIEMGARVSHSLISGGCVIEGTVEYAVLSPGVYVGPGAVVRNAIIMHNTTIEERAHVHNAILDMDVTVGSLAQVGKACRYAPTLSRSELTPITLVPKGAHIPSAACVGPEPSDNELVLSTRDHVRADTNSP